MQTVINPLVVSMGPINETNITPIPMTAHGGGVKKIVGIVAAVALPFAAPAIAGAIGLSAAIGAATTATIGAVVGSAIVGAGLGAITAAVTGQNIAKGALFGGISGGVGGYGARANVATSTSGAPAAGQGANLQAGLSGQTSSYNPTIADSPLVFGGTTTNLSSGVNTSGIDFSDPGGGGFVGPEAAEALSNTAATSEGFVATMKSKLSSAGQMLVDKIADPEALANAALKVAGSITSNAMVDSPGTAQTDAAMQQYEQELALLKERDEAAFNQKLEASQQYMVQAGYYDPQYFANQAANTAAIAEGRKLREFERTAGLRTGGISEGERRRAALAGTQNVQSSYDRGFQQGVGLRDQAISTGVGLIPSAPTSAINATYQLANMRKQLDDEANVRADAERSNIQTFFGGFNTKTGLTKEQEEEQERITRGAITSQSGLS